MYVWVSVGVCGCLAGQQLCMLPCILAHHPPCATPTAPPSPLFSMVKSCLLCCGFSLRFGLSPRRSRRPRKCASTFFTFHVFAFAMESGCVCVRGGVCGLNSPAHICAFSQCVFLFDLRSLSLPFSLFLSLTRALSETTKSFCSREKRNVFGFCGLVCLFRVARVVQSFSYFWFMIIYLSISSVFPTN